jgi:hypothetical protein
MTKLEGPQEVVDKLEGPRPFTEMDYKQKACQFKLEAKLSNQFTTSHYTKAH